jgi:hypothetical protein
MIEEYGDRLLRRLLDNYLSDPGAELAGDGSSIRRRLPSTTVEPNGDPVQSRSDWEHHPPVALSGGLEGDGAPVIGHEISEHGDRHRQRRSLYRFISPAR